MDRLPARSVRSGRLAWVLVVGVVFGWAVARAGLSGDLVNGGGWSRVGNFLAAALNPELDPSFLRLTLTEAGTTVAYAVLGTALSLTVGIIFGPLVSELWWRPLMTRPAARGRSASVAARRLGWLCGRALLALPRSVHEVVWGLLLLSVLGLDPLVAVLAIGLPFGAVTAKVFSEIVDDVGPARYRALRASGAGKVSALAYGVLPAALPDLLSYGFYRFECAIRAAAILGLVGAGGLGFQIALSFNSLEYSQMWTLLYALVILSGLADLWSSAVRRRQARPDPFLAEGRISSGARRDRILVASAAAGALLVPVCWWWLDLSLTGLVSERTWRLGGDLLAQLMRPLAEGGVARLAQLALDTVALAVLAIGIAFSLGCIVAVAAAGNAASRTAARAVLLFCRAIPPPVWALLFLFVLFPGLWPGAVALGVYNFGVLGRLMAESVENLDDEPGAALVALGARRGQVLGYALVPAVSARFVALGLYRWEVAIRETVVVGVVGAAGLGRLLDEQLSEFAYSAVAGTLLALVIVTLVVDVVGAAVRRSIR